MWDSKIPKQIVLFVEVEKIKTEYLIVAFKQKVESEDFAVDVETLDSESLNEAVPEKAVCSMMVLNLNGFPVFQGKKLILLR